MVGETCVRGAPARQSLGGKTSSERGESKRGSDKADPEPLYPQLRARKNASPKAVAAHQRARLHAAMIEACDRQGYAATTVREVVALAGVSKKTLYRHFESKEGCFVATYDLVVQQAMERISAAYRAGAEGGDWTAGLCRAFEAFVEELVERPKPSRLALVDVLAAGPAALEHAERAEAIFARMIAQSLSQAPDGGCPPPLLLRSMVGGVWFVSRNRLLADRSSSIADCAQELHEWILSYRAPAAASIPRAPVPAAIARAALWKASREGDERLRMLLAAAQIATEGGFPALTAGQICERAGVGEETFAAAFEDVGDCFLTSLEMLSADALARAMRAGRDAPDWPTGVCRAIQSLLARIARDPVFARTVFVEVFAAGPSGVERRAALMEAFAGLLVRRAPAAEPPSPLVAEAIVGAVWSLAHRQVVRGRAPALASLWGHAAFLALAPMIGAEAALGAIAAEPAGGAAVAEAEPSPTRALSPA